MSCIFLLHDAMHSMDYAGIEFNATGDSFNGSVAGKIYSVESESKLN